MAKENEIKTAVPALRFPEFQDTEGWKEYKLKNLCEIGNGKDYKHLSSGNIPLYGSGGYMTSVDDFLYDGESVCIGRKGTIDKPIFLTGKFWTVDTLFYTHSFNNCLPKFLYLIFQKINWYKYNEAGGVPSLSKTTIGEINVFAPVGKKGELKEQQKIADCLSSLDELIEATTQKVETLKEHKKGLMQRLFPAEGKNVPDLRFPEFQGTSVWQSTLLGAVVDYENGRAHENEIDEEGNFIVVNSKFISTDGEVVKRTNTPYCLADKEDILMVLSDVPNGRAIAKCFFVDQSGKYTVNQRICRLRSKNINSKLLFYLINRNPYFLSFDDGVKQTNLKKSEVLECPLMIPSSPIKQQKIADLLSSIDDLIIATGQRIKSLKEHKKGLMQQLFPKI
ncbi:restriction endonuclease subunit S [Bacteroides sp. ET225]|uniref:restriction endonuclease subunit S n=1 Tax=Bacteroides sp. ET225 TaxID=2972461 RepID=UPI0021AD2CC1|nr:restriction endonuclease subunit S [Bacteroides sp. ET225]MCR8917431.1 restriction endonuclease subunit S [Bacteroides sp. ET225]